MRVDVFCGGSGEPFVYDVSVDRARRAVASFKRGMGFQFEAVLENGAKKVAYFNPSRVDAIQLWEET